MRVVPQKQERSRFINNSTETLKERMQNRVNSAGTNLCYFDCLVGYFYLGGFKHLAEIFQSKLKNFKEIRILVGIKTDLGSKFDREKLQKYFSKEQADNLDQSDLYDETTELSLDMFEQYIKDQTIKVQIMPKSNVHAKFYILSTEPQAEKNGYDYTGYVIIGSSNLTHNGLIKNYEFNAELRDSNDIETALYEFNTLWENSIPISESHISEIRKTSYLRHLNAQELYYKLLIEYFKDRISNDVGPIENLFPQDFKPLKYQIHAIKEGLSKLKKYRGFFLSDVTGLGKTLIASVIAKKLFENFRSKESILVVSPPSIQENWKEMFGRLDLLSRVVFSTSDGLRKVENRTDFSLIIVDESHRFKNNSTDRYKKLKSICEQSQFDTKVILVSATPQTNTFEDLENQIYLFAQPRNFQIGKVKNLESFFKDIKSKDQKNKDQSKNMTSQDLSQTSTPAKRVRDDLLRYIMVRRTREDIKRIFGDDLREQGLTFPKSNPPKTLRYELTLEQRKLVLGTYQFLSPDYSQKRAFQYACYLIYPHLTQEGKQKYIKAHQKELAPEIYEQNAVRLKGLMNCLLFKRFESSTQAFLSTLDKIISSTQGYIEMFEQGGPIIPGKSPEDSIESYDLEGESDPELDKQNKIRLEVSDFLPSYLEKLKEDEKILLKIQNYWQAQLQYDRKLSELVRWLERHLQNKQDDVRKVVIFTESIETARYIAQGLGNSNLHNQVLQVDSGNRKSNQHKIRENFDASLPQDEQKNDIEILISTDTLSEGVNMHRAGVIINYDIPWNPTQLMQRIGRIDRVGTKHKEIFIYNFALSDSGDEILKFSSQVLHKLQNFHDTLGSDTAVYTESEKVSNQGLYDRNPQQEDEDIDPEAEYLAEVLDLQAKNPKEFARLEGLPKKSRVILEGREKSFFYFREVTKKHYEASIEEHMADYFYEVTKEGVREADFVQMASYLKENIPNPPLTPSQTSHYKHYKQALEYHNNRTRDSMKRLDKEEKARENAKTQIELDITLSKEERELLLNALENGQLKEHEAKIAKGRDDLKALVCNLNVRAQENSIDILIKREFSLQLSYTLGGKDDK